MGYDYDWFFEMIIARNYFPRIISLSSFISTHKKHCLPDLPYDYNALEPVISGQIMEIHHQKHHAAYVNNLNIAEEKTQEALLKGDIRTVIQQQNILKFNGGGHINHSIFWTNLCKDGGQPNAPLLEAINRDFGSLQNMQNKLNAIAIAVQGSGWGWLGYNKEAKRLELACCLNQDPLEPTTGLVPLFGIDVWEHAYYLQYKNVRADYVKAIWNIANWKNIEERFENALNS